ncbi:MAG: DsbA family protein [Bdellovibrionales bacterium]
MLKTVSKHLILTTAIVAGIGAFTFGHFQSSHAQEAAFSDAQKEALDGIMKDYIMNNTQVIFDSIDAYRAEEEKMKEEKAASAIKDNISKLQSEDSPSIGPADADVTIVEFFDYNCGYCKRALPDVLAISQKDKNVRFVFKEMPILGPSSTAAAQWALAAQKQGKYFEYHSALMEFRGPKEEKQLSQIAKDLDLDLDQMKKDASSSDVQNMIDRDVELARTIGINGTPAFIVGETLYPGYIGEDGMVQAIEEARAN